MAMNNMENHQGSTEPILNENDINSIISFLSKLTISEDETAQKELSTAEVKNKKLGIMQTYDMFKYEIRMDSLTHFINQPNSFSNLKMNLCPGNRNIKLPAKWQICDQIENHNPFTLAAFLLRKKEYDIINHGQFKIVEMYHNTPLYNAPNILVNNFDYRRNRQNRRRYGPGTCFSCDLYYCFQCTDRFDDEFSLIISDVLIGKTVDKDKYIESNQISVDTGVSLNKKVFVKARDDEFYPKYIMTYRVNK